MGKFTVAEKDKMLCQMAETGHRYMQSRWVLIGKAIQGHNDNYRNTIITEFNGNRK